MTGTSRRLVITFAIAICAGTGSPLTPAPAAQGVLADPIVFVSRQIPTDGSDFLPLSEADRAMPGVGGRERFRVAAPGRLLVREANGAIRSLVDGSNPTATSKFLIDVSAPAVSYDGTRIAFAGLPAPPAGQTYDTGSHAEPGTWRIFVIGADGSSLRQVTANDPALDAIDMAQWGRLGERYHYDDTDPAWLPDGRIVFSSTRWMSVAEYGRARGTNLHVVDADGRNEHRITSERNGADRPIVDPLTGRIVFARWWLNGRFPSDRTDTIRLDDRGGHESFYLKDGLTIGSSLASGGPGVVTSNTWVAASVNPDGTDMRLWMGSTRIPHFTHHYYGGTFTASGVLYGNFFPDHPLTESGGFGGIRRYLRGGDSDPVWGLTRKSDDLVRPEPPQSLTIIRSASGYAADPVPLPDGRVLFSWARNPDTGAEDIGQDYGLFVLDPRGSAGPVAVYDVRGTTELRAQLLRPRPLPPIVSGESGPRPTATPVGASESVFRDGTFAFESMNVYANGPVDMPIVNAPAIGSAATIRFFVNHQRVPLNQDMTLNYPVLLDQRPVQADGSVRHSGLPANVPLFEDLRAQDGSVPLTTLDDNLAGGAFVTGVNHGRPGTTARCVGCHAGHTQITVPATPEEARWSNVAPGARVSASSSTYHPPTRLINRRARTEEVFERWKSREGTTVGQWVDLAFPVPILVRTVRLWGPADGTRVRAARVQLYADDAHTVLVAERDAADLSDGGTSVPFADVQARAVRITFTAVDGTHASLAEVEVEGAGSSASPPPPPPPPPPTDTTPPTVPGNVAVRFGADGAPVVSWSPSTDDSGIAVNAYVVRRNGGPGVNVSGVTYRDGAAVAGVSYAYTVSARDHAGNESAPSAPTTITVPQPGPTVPSNLRVRLDRRGRPVVSWNASTAAAGMAGYHVHRNSADLARVTSLSYLDRQTTGGTTYSYQVQAVDVAGQRSALTAPVSITLPARTR